MAQLHINAAQQARDKLGSLPFFYLQGPSQKFAEAYEVLFFRGDGGVWREGGRGGGRGVGGRSVQKVPLFLLPQPGGGGGGVSRTCSEHYTVSADQSGQLLLS